MFICIFGLFSWYSLLTQLCLICLSKIIDWLLLSGIVRFKALFFCSYTFFPPDCPSDLISNLYYTVCKDDSISFCFTFPHDFLFPSEVTVVVITNETYNRAFCMWWDLGDIMKLLVEGKHLSPCFNIFYQSILVFTGLSIHQYDITSSGDTHVLFTPTLWHRSRKSLTL